MVWAERARLWRESGQTQVAYCAAQGISVWMLRKWKLTLERSGLRFDNEAWVGCMHSDEWKAKLDGFVKKERKA